MGCVSLVPSSVPTWSLSQSDWSIVVHVLSSSSALWHFHYAAKTWQWWLTHSWCCFALSAWLDLAQPSDCVLEKTSVQPKTEGAHATALGCFLLSVLTPARTVSLSQPRAGLAVDSKDPVKTLSLPSLTFKLRVLWSWSLNSYVLPRE